MIFGKRKKENVVLSIDGINIERVSELQFLGISLDDGLIWKSHILHVRKKMSKSIFLFNKVKYGSDYDAMRTLYCALILPYISYCAEVWGNTYKSNMNPFYLLQKRAIGIIHKADYREHTNLLFINSGLLKLQELVKLQTLLVMCRAKYNELPANLQKLFLLLQRMRSIEGKVISSISVYGHL